MSVYDGYILSLIVLWVSARVMFEWVRVSVMVIVIPVRFSIRVIVQWVRVSVSDCCMDLGLASG